MKYMTKPTVVLTYPINQKSIDKNLKPFANVIIADSKTKLDKALPKADGLITLLADKITAELISKAPKLRVIGNYAVGVDNIDLKSCKKRNIAVVNTPRVLTRATAELAVSLLFAAARRITEGDRMCRAGKFKGWKPELLQGIRLEGRHSLIVGTGRIGNETGKLFKALGMSVDYVRSNDSKHVIKNKLKKAQILSLHLPLTPETHHWLNKSRIKLLPHDAIVINTARGPVVDEDALIDALKNKKIFAAAFDVYEREPSIPISLRKLQNVVLSPHLGSATVETRKEMADAVTTGVMAVLSGKKPWNLLNH